ncbi:MAG TPA: sensor histidine kinase [Pseudonocardiaceae bacterium]|nr:sensor histidine kinase [Pseudonocardiaceae bacterium]
MFYRSDGEYLSVLVPFVTEGLAAGHPVAVAVPEPNLALLRGALGAAADDVTMIDMEDAGRNPGRIIADVLLRFADRHRDRHVRIIGEPIWPGRTATEYPACAQHEALINPAFAGRDVTIVCPYDVVRLDPEVVADARATHPVLWETDRRYRSDQYDPDHVVARYNRPLDGAPETTAVIVATAAELPGIRRFATHHARNAGVPASRVADVELIVTELVTNSLDHTDGPCWVRIWSDHNHLTCEVRDTGHLTDPLAGRRPAPREQWSGRGLLLVNSLADLVRTHTTAAGTTIRALLNLHRR